ncbi:MAG: hypothetical protein L6V85_10305 [Clostridiales bacterium]|nr:MAG: hypothetical protein L6V85_10305 [Clostridiales bacterium]
MKELEDDKLQYLDFVELNACDGGCVGGVLNVENPVCRKGENKGSSQESEIHRKRAYRRG